MEKKEIWNKFLLPIMENFAAPYSVLRRIFPQIFLLGLIVYFNSLIFVYFQHLDWISAIYAGINVVTTVGLYAPNINQMPSTEKLFLTVTIIFAVGLYASMVQSIVSTVVKRSTWLDAKARWRGSHMRSHTVVIGKGEVILSSAKRLEKLGVDYVVLTSSKEISDSLKSDRVILGDPTKDKDLLDAGIMEAKNAIICMDDDMNTLLVTLKVQKLNPPLSVIAVVKNENIADEFKTAGADIVIPYEEIVGRITAAAAVSNNVAGLIFSMNKVREDIVIGVFDIKNKIMIKDLPKEVIPLAIVKDGKINPYFSKDTELEQGESLIILGNPSSFKRVRDIVG
ncbi:potassium channel family protein [Acidianus brierleyi]|uniref:Potassium transporter TrkA n=1 Tax=Acidianus brierleyi TaxID=41673 RepID=A0A2U9IDS2_9CREN|nr:NAD(P)-binding protein [Acidianus brierleyi]AWR94175.1 potassium transporter TrkA [Acidianus brierleyi]